MWHGVTNFMVNGLKAPVFILLFAVYKLNECVVYVQECVTK